MAKDRLENRPGFNNSGGTKSTEKSNGKRPRAAVSKDLNSSTTNKGIDRQSPRLISSKTWSSKENVRVDKVRRRQQATQFPSDRTPRDSSPSKRYLPLQTQPADGRSHLKTKTTSTSTSSYSQQNSLSSKQRQSKISSPEPKSILKNSPRRRTSSTSLSEDVLGPSLNQTTTFRSSSPPTSPPALSSSLPLKLEFSGGNRAASSFSLPLTSFSTSFHGDEESQELLSRLRACYTRSISERPSHTPLGPPDLASQSQDSEGEILSRCSYKLGPRLRRSSEPSRTKRVTFHDQTMTIGDGFYSLKF